MILQKIGDYRKKLYKDGYVLTKFLDLEEQKEIFTLQDSTYFVHLYGGYSEAERKRAYISSCSDVDFSRFEINIYDCTYPVEFGALNHRNILGAIMSLGIERNTFGDIIVHNDHIVLISSREMGSFLMNNLVEVNHKPMNFSLVVCVDSSFYSQPVLKTVIVPSFRLDVILAKSLGKSRNECCDIINGGFVSVNYKDCKNITYIVKVDDILSIRHFGRITYKQMLKNTKKDNYVIEIEVRH